MQELVQSNTSIIVTSAGEGLRNELLLSYWRSVITQLRPEPEMTLCGESTEHESGPRPKGNTYSTDVTMAQLSDIVLIIQSPVVTIRTATFNISKIVRSAHTVYLCVLCGSENKQGLLPYTALTGWFV